MAARKESEEKQVSKPLRFEGDGPIELYGDKFNLFLNHFGLRETCLASLFAVVFILFLNHFGLRETRKKFLMSCFLLSF